MKRYINTNRNIFLLALLLVSSISSLRAQFPGPGSGGPGPGSGTLNILGTNTAIIDDIKTYHISVTGTIHSSTAYLVSGGTVISQSKNQVQVKWTTVGSNRTLRATASTNGGSIVKYHYVTVSCAVEGGSISGTSPVCYNGNPGELSNGTLASKGSGYAYQWQRRIPGGGWSNIPGATGHSYDPPASTATREYRRRVIACGQTAYSNTVTVTVRPALGAGSIGNAQKVCYNGNPSTLTNTASPTGGYGGFSYQWEHRSPGHSWTNIPGATGSTYNPPPLTSTKEYRRRVSSCSQTKHSNTVVVTVRTSLTAGNIGNAQTVCYNGNPSTLSHTGSPTGGTGIYSYQWQHKSLGGSWSDISGATDSIYNPPPLTATREYRRKVSSCGQTKLTSSIIVNVQPNLTAGSIGNAQTVCYNENPLKLNSTGSPTGGNGVGSYLYQWQQRSPGGSWTNISDATGFEHDPPALTATTEYRRTVTSCEQTVHSNIITITVDIPSTPNAPSISSNTCGPKTVTRVVPPAGEAWYWQTLSDGESIADSLADYEVNESGTYYLRALSSGGCWGHSRSINVTVNEIPATPTISGITYNLDNIQISPNAAPVGETWYWQTGLEGEDDAQSGTLSTTVAGTYYLRSKSDSSCWGDALIVTLSTIAPSNVQVVPTSNQSVRVQWNPLGGNESGFNILRASNEAGPYTEVHQALGSDTEYEDTNLSPATTYYYRVQSRNGTEKSVATSSMVATTPVYNVVETQDFKTNHNGNIAAMRWKGPGDDTNQRYTFGYDGLNRLKKAHYAANNGAANKGYYSVPEISYDLNGNIESLTRQGLNGTKDPDKIDVLSYDYHSGATGNQLMGVSDSGGESGFKDGNTVGDDYAYDPNGNMVKDRNKGIDTIYYNHLNLPIKVIISPLEGGEGGDSITYTYDAAGIKLRQAIYNGGNLKKATDYIGEYIYETDSNGTRSLQLIQHDEGRIIPVIASLPDGQTGGSEAISSYDYQYHLKDHLGNVRATFSTTPENYTMVETFETGEENGWQDLHRLTRVSANTTTGGDEVEMLQSGQTGAMILLNVNKGDTIHLSVNANYESAPNGNTFMSTAYSALFTSFDNVYGGGEGGISGTSPAFHDALNGVDMNTKGDASTAPRAFLNYILFDEEMNFELAGFKQISTAALGVGVHETISINDIVADREGFILAYLSNENQEVVNVHFDDFTVYHGKTNVVSTQDYYPFGLTFNESARMASTEQRFKYNGKELQEGTGWLDYGARMYTTEIGRWFNIDPLAEEYFAINPYAYVANSPIILGDPNGKEISLSVTRNDKGEITRVNLTIIGKIINNSEKKLSAKQMERRMNRINKGLNNLKIDGVDLSVNSNISIANSESDISSDDHVFRIVDDITKVDGVNSNSGTNPEGYAPLGENVIYLENDFTGKIAAHELGHSAGLKHINQSSQADFDPGMEDFFNYFRDNRNTVNFEGCECIADKYIAMRRNAYTWKDFKGNLMHRGVRPDYEGNLVNNTNQGYMITKGQIERILHNINNGKINKGGQK